MPIRTIIAFFVFCSLGLCGSWTTSPVSAQDRVENWLADIDYLVEHLPRKHKNLFFKISREEFLNQAELLKSQVKDLPDYAVVAEMMKLVASVGDGHTTIGVRDLETHVLPVQFHWFKDGLFIVNASVDHAMFYGGRVTSIGGLKVEEVISRASQYLPHDNEWQLKNQVASVLGVAETLNVIGAWDSLESGTIEIEKKGRSKTIKCETTKRKLLAGSKWVSRSGPEPLYSRKSGLDHWNDLIPDTKLMYFKYNRCRDAEAFNRLVNGSAGYVTQNPGKIKGFVLDLRDNGGGNSEIFNPLFDYLTQKSPFNRKGKLFVIIGRRTFSSAVLNAMKMKQTNAIFVGEPSGGKPNHYGEVKSFELPNSKLAVQYSTKYFRRVADSDPLSVMPDIGISMTFDDWDKGRDPVLDAVIQRFEER